MDQIRKRLKDSERSLISETVSIEGTINSSGAIDIAGLDKRSSYFKRNSYKRYRFNIRSLEADRVEVYGHLDGKISGDDVVVGSTGTVKGDIEFGDNLKTENGADIDGYIKKTQQVQKSKLAPDFLFSKIKKKKIKRKWWS